MARRMPARYKTGPKKGQFKPKGRKNAPAKRRAPKRRRARRNSTKKGGRRTTARRAYMRTAAPKRRRSRARRNAPMFPKDLMQVALWAAGATVGAAYVSPMLGRVLPAAMRPWLGWITTLAVGAGGLWLTRKAKTKNAGYAVVGIAAGQAAAQLASQFLAPTTSEGAFIPRRRIVRPIPQNVQTPYMNPVANIVVPG